MAPAVIIGGSGGVPRIAACRGQASRKWSHVSRCGGSRAVLRSSYSRHRLLRGVRSGRHGKVGWRPSSNFPNGLRPSSGNLGKPPAVPRSRPAQQFIETLENWMLAYCPDQTRRSGTPRMRHAPTWRCRLLSSAAPERTHITPEQRLSDSTSCCPTPGLVRSTLGRRRMDATEWRQPGVAPGISSNDGHSSAPPS